MTRERFEELIREFISRDFYDYAYGDPTYAVWHWDDEFPTDAGATIKMESWGGYFSWDIPIRVSPDDEDEIVIDLGDDSYTDARGEGLYAYLWHEAQSRITTLKDKIERMEAASRGVMTKFILELNKCDDCAHAGIDNPLCLDPDIKTAFINKYECVIECPNFKRWRG